MPPAFAFQATLLERLRLAPFLLLALSTAFFAFAAARLDLVVRCV